MKHLLNDLSEEVKNSIREQHTGGMKVITENFSKLLNTKSGTVRPLVSEQDNVEPRYKHRLGHQDRWYDEDDRVSDDFEDYDDEFEFGPDDYDSFTDMVGGFDNKWNPSFRKHYYDKYTETSPLKIRRKQMGMSEQATTTGATPNTKYMAAGTKMCFYGSCRIDIKVVDKTTSQIITSKGAEGPDVNSLYPQVVKLVQDELTAKKITGVTLPTLQQLQDTSPK